MPSQPVHTKGLPSVATILVNGSPLTPDDLLEVVEVRVEQAVRVASRALLRFSDHEFKLIDGNKFDIGSKLEVSFLDGNGKQQKVFVGEITSIGIEQSMTSGHELVVEAFDEIHRLGHDSKPTTYLKQSYGQVIRKIAQENGLQARVDGSLNQPIHEYLARACTPAAFLDMIAVRTGTEWFIDASTLNVRKRTKAAVVKEIVYGEDLVRFKARFSGSDQVKEVRVTSWDPASKKEVVATVTTKATGAVNEADGAAGLRKAATKSGVLHNGKLAAMSSDEATAIANGLSTRRSSTDLVARGDVHDALDLKAGSFVSIKGVGTKMGGKYYLTSVEHIFGQGGDLITRFTAGPIEGASIVDLLGDQGNAGGGWGVSGLVVGLVTNNKDPDGLHRVKVKFPTLSDTEESNWARIATLGAGKNRGLQMLPQINDEVLVGFEHGDLRRPMILGSLWNGRDTPPAPAIDKLLDQGKVMQWGLTTTAGHTLMFRDGPDDKNVEIKTIDGKTKLLLDQTKIELFAGGKTMELTCGQSTIKLESNGTITFTGQKIVLDASNSVDVQSKATVNVKANASLKLGATMIELKADGMLQGQASGSLILKGNPALIN